MAIKRYDIRYIEVTKTEIDSLITGDLLVSGSTYKITGCDIATFGAPGVTLILQALDVNKLSLYGTAEPSATIVDWKEIFYNYEEDLISTFGIGRGSYSYFTTIVNENRLTPEKSYILDQYVHKYYIEESNTSPKKVFRTITSKISVYLVLDNSVLDDLSVGMTVTIEELPPGYTGTLVVGSTTTVSSNDFNYYWRFANGMHNSFANIDVVISYIVNRFPTIDITNQTIYDTYGKVIMKPGGVLNTDVHNGTVYGDMAAGDNFTPPTESILLRAKTENSFYEQCVSLTYKNDELIYDFNDSIVRNDNREQIGTRNGFIKSRANKELNIDIDKDWRAQRYRRWLLPVGTTSSDYRKKLLNIDYPNTNLFSAFQSKYIYTSEYMNVNSTENMYICSSVETSNITAGMTGSVDSFAIQVSGIGGTGSTASIVKFKDFPIFGLNSSLEPSGVDKCIINNLENTVFVEVNSTFNYDLSLSTERYFYDSTFFGYPQIIGSNTAFDNVNVFDNLQLSGSDSRFTDVNMLSYFNGAVNDTTIENVIFGSLPYNVFLTGMGGLPINTPVRWINLETSFSNIENCLIGVGTGDITLDYTNVNGGGIFHYGSPLSADIGLYIVDSNFTNTNFNSYYSQNYNVNSVILSNKSIKVTQVISNVTLKTDANSVLYYQNMDILVPANTVTKYYDTSTSLFTTI
jgi:hypothetical protein